MILLAVDTALDACAAAVVARAGDRLDVVAETEVIGRGHAETLMRVVGRALARAGIGHGDLSGYAVTVGPGSFTGIRVGVAAVRGFSLVTGRPAVSVTTLEALAAEARALAPGRPIFAALDARKDEVYAQGFDALGAAIDRPVVIGRGEALARAKALGAVGIGSGAGLLAGLDPSFELLSATPFPAIETIGRIGFARLEAGAPSRPPAPLYVRPPDAKPQDAARLARLRPAASAPTPEARP